MKNLMIVESILVGFLVGVSVSAYMLYMDTAGRSVGKILDTLSLNTILKYTKYENSLFVPFLFYVALYIVYVFLVNILLRMNKKVKISTILILLLLICGIIFEQKKAFSTEPNDDITIPVVNSASQNELKKYFGENEVFGNLNDDNREDVAFVVKIYDEESDTNSYYISVSTKNSDGYSAKNLLYVEDDIQIESLKIDAKKIYLQYKNEDESILFVAELIDDELKEFKEEISQDESIQE